MNTSDTCALGPAVAEVLARLDAHAAGRAPADLDDTADRGTALETVRACFALTRFERDVLVLTAAMELDPGTPARCAAASGRPFPTFSLALAALRDPHWSALTPDGPLRRWRLVDVENDGSLTSARLRIDERILHFLAGAPGLDHRLRGLARRVPSPAGLPASQTAVADRLAARWREHAVDLAGGDRPTRWETAAVAADGAGLALYAMDSADIPAEPAERDALGRLWEREAVLLPAALVVEVSGDHRVESFVDALAVPVAVSADEPPPSGRPRLTVTTPTRGEQRELWSSALNGVATLADGRLKDLVAQFSLPAHVIRQAGETVRRGTAEGADPAELAWHAGRSAARTALEELGQRIEPRATPDDLVLPARQQAILGEIVAHVRRRGTVYQDWGFESVLRRGLGVTALFAGGSGTGKTLAAEVVAGRLGLDLFVIDLSQVVSKYIGETEKNLRRVFDAAERGGSVLLFDEADALFGKRSEVRDSHDRYANLEVSYLLMRMEAYRGLAVLTTNMKKAIDTAFLRRIRFVVDFPFPAAAERARIWRRVIPAATPVDALDVDRLAQLTVAGGSIRNIALSAAFLAADEGTSLGMSHLLAASRTEYLKLERSLTAGEVAGWV
ncbi:ATP-binding protein [Amycolatopsis mongoliensis]|uniref:ATP-binding protein n=1 Tax=Amycolatopsis mongoliensis TaxID=715475 RepID=A0A9Y2JJG9_9PSEU|nr:ATP-binding protein [Amycolatopsis sp. 4-36]WIX99167.1 ATP-binding protein [Amycolatopsis sp. 4-36]